MPKIWVPKQRTTALPLYTNQLATALGCASYFPFLLFFLVRTITLSYEPSVRCLSLTSLPLLPSPVIGATMILYECRFGTLWITTLALCYYSLVVGGQTLGSLTTSGCFRWCLIPRCPGLETNCVCSGFRAALEVADIWECALQACPTAVAMAGFAILVDECRPSISTSTRSSRTRSRTTILPPFPTSSPTSASTTTSNVISTSTS
ncbi:unnamed protein product, partial [Tuber aestivum]